MTTTPTASPALPDLGHLEALARAATPGPWSWWTSNSTLRLTGADGRNGGVLYGYARHGNGDANCAPNDQAFISAANPAALLALIALARRAAQQAAAPGALPDYVPGRWFEARTLDEMQSFYLSRLPAIRAAAKEHGYAIGLHGSQRRDFDLIAMQWRGDAADKDTLARAIAEAACGIRREGAYDWEAKPSGRVAVSLPVCWTACDNPDFDKPSVGHIDLSVIDHLATSAPGTPEAPQPPFPVSDEEMAALRRFWECASDGEGYDVEKTMMQRLAEMGLVQRKSGAYYMVTEFGLYVLREYTIPRAAQLDGGQEGSESNG